jgi:sigma-B regulation protein RsbU (phosphoserine phosphatase)
MSARALLRLQLPARAESLKPLRDAVCAAMARAGVAPDLRDRLKLAIDEAAANVIRHAYGNCGEGEFRIAVTATRGTLRFALRDHAPAVDPARIRPRDLSECRPGGLGINFIDETMDHWRLRPLRRGGNLLVMRKRIRARNERTRR